MSVQRDESRLDALAAIGPAQPHAQAETDVPLLNIANVLTMLRIVLVPLFVLALFVDDGHDTAWRITAAALFAVAAITDRFDGQLARKYGLVTDFGKLADPIADKALIGSALIGLSVLGDLAWWMTIVICGREIGVTLLRLAVVRRGVIPAGRGGKLKTLVQSLAIGFLLLPLSGGFATAGMLLMWLALILTVVTGLDYVGQAARLWFAGSSRARGT
ncbi:CDP-diacylglycerol--glycerol-3-phosphate 3-phosphatidyltransferase [Nocardia donostiensis]|uniref:CDP-diacylglycerol--glycerol-3-phosphate 3-phosphatidyltransferase n=1 Tax=Nocardia donostiensis TaxID=1538463 RepID=A0A1V2TE42_9NOCA|nr:CDP-diacylglycerol--glycerol-3-phosphate 3-phosphatidyltransferase [Nocardia donostiensis]ONM47790.1 CDP-diacylglycerol--glycerol-3-phosphate 3-phosphatidyltransferase [Nocardia donostiensis]OQS13721.1 CDP-diacylglycerol--glycerol-3-phosphate 3-phosphatidyltransferase [Nocardia donostiensis]OQS22542.1 CDP-diacylglycerol--glycerol-3-phosphate 3-phosphatidyltransferase [Nocardia donostiensis]